MGLAPFGRVTAICNTGRREDSVTRDHAKQTGIALEKAYQFTLWLIPTVEKFPRSQKFVLGDRIETAALDVVEGIVDATYTRNRAPILRKINLRLEKLRLLFRLSVDLKLVDARRYENAVRNLDELGRLIGGWLKRIDGEAEAR